MAIHVNITHVKKNLARLIDQLRDSHEEIFILRHGRSVAKLTGLNETSKVQPQDLSRDAVSSEDEALRAQIKSLISRHTQLEDQKLLLALWFNRQNSKGDVHLLEIAEGFPDNGLGRLETFSFASTPDFQIPGHLHLTLTSPTEIEDALRRGDPIFQRILADASREVVYQTALGSKIWGKLT